MTTATTTGATEAREAIKAALAKPRRANATKPRLVEWAEELVTDADTPAKKLEILRFIDGGAGD